MSTLLERAKEHGTNRRLSDVVTDEQIELALAWLNEEVTTSQVARALSVPQSQHAYPRICAWIKRAYKLGLLTRAELGKGDDGK